MQIQVDGRDVYVYTAGRAAIEPRPAVIFLHGAQQDHTGWVPFCRWFVRHGLTVLAPDLPGHGRSAGTALASVEALADWAVALLDAVGVSQATWVGHSMGSLISVSAAHRHADRVARLVLVGTAMPMAVSDALLDAARHDEARAMAMINGWSFAQRSQLGASATPGMCLPGINLGIMRRQAAGVIHTDLNACKAFQPPPLSTIGCPALVVTGGRDLMTPARAGKAVAQALRDARWVNLATAGHSIMAEDPDGLLDALISFAAG